MNLGRLATESRNVRSENLDTMTTMQVLDLMNEENRSVSDAIAKVLTDIEQAVTLVASSLRSGGRLVYLGAGTSGRLGLLDAVECPPTFSTEPDQVMAMLAGGEQAFVHAVEGAEDDPAQAALDVDAQRIGPRDTVVGIAASGRTPYVVGGLRRARHRGASTVALACNAGARISAEADVAIEVLTGPEVLTGSTRLKAGTAQKMVCNMISTAAMVAIGKTFGNLMVDLRPTNAKLVDRARRIVATAADVDEPTAERAIAAAGGHAKVAILMLLTGVEAATARALLDETGGVVSAALSG